MRKLVTSSLLGLLIVAPLSAQEPVQGEREHTVRTGDTLWDLAELYLQDPFQWPSIYSANRLVVEDPHWIYPAEVLAIPTIGAPERDASRSPAARAAEDRSPLGVHPARSDRGSGATVERVARERVVAQDQDPTVVREPVIPVVPVTAGEFTTAPYLTDVDALDVRGRFLRTTREGRGGATTAHPMDRVLLTHVGGSPPRMGDRVAVVRVGRWLDGSRLIHPTGIIRVWGYRDGTVEGQVEAQFGPIYPDQLVIPLESAPDLAGSTTEPVESGADLVGSILAFADEQPLYGLRALALLDLGRRDGVEVGDLFHVHLPDADPPELVARLRVVRVTGGYATAKVEQLVQPLLHEELPVRRVGTMP